MSSHTLATIAIVLLATATTSKAAEPFAGPHTDISVTTLEFPVGIRNVGMGATGVADLNQPTTGYFNPATLAWVDAAYATYAYEELILDFAITDVRAAFGNRWGDESSNDVWRLGGELGYTMLDYNNEPIRTIFLPEGTAESIERDYYLTSAIAGGWERGNESIGVGAAAKYLTLDRSNDDPHSWLFDFGLVAAKKIMVNGAMVRPCFGVSFANVDTGLGIDSTEYDVAGLTRYGVGVDFATAPTQWASRDVALASGSFDADYTDRGKYDSLWSIGWELSILELVQARAGYQWYDDDGYADDRSNLSLGFGIGWEFGQWIIHGDYAHVRPRPNSVDVDLDRNMFGATLGARF